MVPYPSLKTAVAKGARLLDRKKKGWELRVCIPDLNMADGRNCILGHVYRPTEEQLKAEYTNGYEVGMKTLFPRKSWLGDPDADWAMRAYYGFDSRRTLRRYWLIEIGKRLMRHAPRRRAR